MVVLAGLTCAGSAPSLAGGGKRPASLPIPGGVADSEGRTGFITGSDGHIDALDLQSGNVLWRTAEQARPVALVGTRLAAWSPVPDKANRLRVLVFDTTQEGKLTLEAIPVTFPDWVAVGLTHGRTFSVTGEAAGDNVLLRWEAHAFYAGGAPPPPEVIRAAKKDAAGVAQVGLKSGKVRMLDVKEVPSPNPAPVPQALKEVKSRQYWTGKSWETGPLIAGSVLAALEQPEKTGPKQKLLLRRWELKTGKALEPITLIEGKELWPQIALGGQHVFVHQALVKEQLPAGDYAWWVFSLETGKQLGKVSFEPGAEGLAVLGSRALFLVPGVAKKRPPGGPFGFPPQPRSLKAFDLASGRLLWDHPVEPVRRLLPLL
jgi:hypothetical protein